MDLKLETLSLKAATGLGVAAFVLGLLMGSTLFSGKYTNGRLSACKDITGAIMQVLPVSLRCELFKGDATIVVGNKHYSLDGKKELD